MRELVRMALPSLCSFLPIASSMGFIRRGKDWGLRVAGPTALSLRVPWLAMHPSRFCILINTSQLEKSRNLKCSLQAPCLVSQY